jgi:hypothetical protein
VVFVFGEHAREIITSEVGLWLVRLLMKDHSKVAERELLHRALERVEPEPEGGWPTAINGWIDDILNKVIVQVSVCVIVSCPGEDLTVGSNGVSYLVRGPTS